MVEEIKVQIILAYEGEPYIVYDASPALIVLAFDAETLPKTDEGYGPWLRELHNHLRDELILIRDHAEEIMLDEPRRMRMIQKGVLVLSTTAIMKGLRLNEFASATVDYYATQSPHDPELPRHRIAFAAETVSLRTIRNLSSADHLYFSDDRGLTEINQSNLPWERLRHSNRRCVSIAGYWNNSGPDGLSLTIESTEPGALDDILEVLNTVILKVAEIKAPKDIMLKYLADCAKHRKGDEAEKLWILGTIAYLEESGQLVSDEYNGMLYMYLDADGLKVDRQDVPP